MGNGFGIASIILGAIGIFFFGIILGPLAIIFGIIQIKKGDNKTLGIIGLILGIIAIIIVILVFLWIVSAPAGDAGGTTSGGGGTYAGG